MWIPLVPSPAYVIACSSFDSIILTKPSKGKSLRVFNKWPRGTCSWNSKAYFYRRQTGKSSWCVGGRAKRQLFQHKLKLMISSALLTLSANSAGIKKQIPANTNQSANKHTQTETTVKKKKTSLDAHKHWHFAVAHTGIRGKPDTHAPVTASFLWFHQLLGTTAQVGSGLLYPSGSVN